MTHHLSSSRSGSANPRSKTTAGSDFRPATIIFFVVVFIAVLLRPLAPAFVFDARMYWGGASALVGGGDVALDGGLGLRGLLSSIIYLPAAGISGILGPDVAAIAVLVQNSLAIAFLGVWLIPRLAGKLVPRQTWHIWVAGTLTGLVCSGFAPFPLMDIWAVLFLLLGVLLLTSERTILLVVAGVFLAITLDLRPAFLVPVILVAAIWTWRNWRSVVFPLVGGIVGFLPQVMFNKHVFGIWSIFAPETFAIAGIQSASASFLVRYDTVAFVEGTDPRLSYCSPSMSAIVDGAPPSSTSELFLTFLQHPVDALLFASQKVSSAVAWEWETPYSNGPQEWVGFFALFTILVAALGLVALIRHALRTPVNFTALQTLAIWLATAATIIVSSPEARFGLPLILVGVLGLLTIRTISTGTRFVGRQDLLFLLAAGVLFALVVIFASTGLAHPAAPGPSTASLCNTN